MLRNSEKLSVGPGVVGAAYPPPRGVEIIELPRPAAFDGGVEGGYIPEAVRLLKFAGEGEFEGSSRNAPSPGGLLFRCLLDRVRVGGGVRGPEASKLYESRLNELCEKLISSSET